MIRQLAKFVALTATLVVALALAVGAGGAMAADKPKVVATFTILGDMAGAVGGDLIDLAILVGPGGDAHLFDPLPGQARAVAEADVLIVNGFDFEEFLPGLIASTGFTSRIIVASDGIVPRRYDVGGEGDDQAGSAATASAGTDVPGAEVSGHGRIDPHAWHDLANAQIYVENITAGLSAADPDNAPLYRANAARYIGEIAALDAAIRAQFDAIPPDRRLIITSHDAFGYFGAAYGLTFEGVVGVTTGDDPSARDIADLIGEINDKGVRALFVETLTSPALIEQIARETGATVGGEIYSDALSEPDGPAATFLDMMRYNAGTIAGALTSG